MLRVNQWDEYPHEAYTNSFLHESLEQTPLTLLVYLLQHFHQIALVVESYYL